MPDIERLGDYQILRRIATGGMGTVYLARHGASKREVALKVLSSQMSGDPDYVARFQREAQATAALRHPHIVQVYDTGMVEGNRYIAMEYLSGGSLQQELSKLIIKRQTMPLARAIQITRQIASALDYAHKRGLVHRDIKPSNIMIAGDGRYVLTDFGIVLTQGSAKLTRNVETIGTPEYMSPEQVQGKDLDRRSDIYSLGIVLYEMLGGIAPFKAENTLAVLYKHVNETPRPIRELRPELSAGLQQLVTKAIAKDPDQRFQTAGELITNLDRAMLGKSIAGNSARRNGVIIGAIVTMVVAAVAAGVAWIQLGQSAAPAAAPVPTPTLSKASTSSFLPPAPPTALPPTLNVSDPSAAGTSAPARPATSTPISLVPTSLKSPTPAASTTTTTATVTSAPTAAVPVSATLLPATAPAPTPQSLATSESDVFVTIIAGNGAANLRESPDNEGKLVTQLGEGTTLKVVSRTSLPDYDWWQVQFPAAPGGLAWIRGDVVQTVGNSLAVATAAPWTLMPFSQTVRFNPRDADSVSWPANKVLDLEWEVQGAQALALEITGEQVGGFTCPAGKVDTLIPNTASGRRTPLRLPTGSFPVQPRDPGYYVFNVYITKLDGTEVTVSKAILVDCAAEPTPTPTPTPVP